MHYRYTFPSIAVILANQHRPESFLQQYRNHPTIISAPAVQLPRCPVEKMPRRMLIATLTIRIIDVPAPETPRLEPVEAVLDSVPSMTLDPHVPSHVLNAQEDELESSAPPTPAEACNAERSFPIEESSQSSDGTLPESSTVTCEGPNSLQPEVTDLRLLFSNISSEDAV